MKKILFAILLCVSNIAMANSIVPTALSGKGLVFESEQVKVVRAHFSPEKSMPKHNHPEAIIVLTVVQGKGVLTIGGKHFDVGNGDAVAFDGNDFIEGVFSEPTQAVISLISKGEQHHTHKH